MQTNPLRETHTVEANFRRVVAGTTEAAPSPTFIDPHTHEPIVQHIARSPWRAEPVVFWSKASAVWWLFCIAYVNG